MEPTSRQSQILSAVITEFTRTGAPVASSVLRVRYALDCSPATIRSEFKALEQAGLLTQPHPSSGRVPTQAAFRLFIDALMRVGSLQVGEARRIASWFGELSPAADIPRETALLLSELAGTASVLIRPKVRARPLVKVHLVPIRLGELLVVVVFADGQVDHRFVHQPPGLGPSEIERLHNLLDAIVPGRTLLQVKHQLERSVEEFRDELRNVCQLAVEALGSAIADPGPVSDVIVQGSARLFEHRQFRDGRAAGAVLRTLSDHESLLRLLRGLLESAPSSSHNWQVLLGEEGLEGSGCSVSVVLADFYQRDPRKPESAEAEHQGALGVIGPTPMDYPALVPVVRAVAQAMTLALNRGAA